VNNQIFSSHRFFALLIAAFMWMLVTLACGGSAAPATSSEESAATAPATELPELIPTEIPETAQPAMPERRYLTLEYPPKIRTGDSDVVRLTLEVDDQGNIVPTAEIEGHVVNGQVVEIPNLYETHNVIAEARFDIAGLEVKPSELISAPLSQGSAATFFWSIRPNEAGVYRGTIWLFLRFVDKTSGEETQKMVSTQIVEIESASFLGLSANLARSTGMVGSIIGTIIGFPFFEDILKFLLKKRLNK
jgi:hypothetical protein